MRLEDPVKGLAVTALFGALTGFAALIGWLEYLRRSPEMREVLAVTENGTPDTTELRIPEHADAEVRSPSTRRCWVVALVRILGAGMR